MPFRINGYALTVPSDGDGIDATGPETHSIAQTQINIVPTIGASIAIEPPSGVRLVHTWHFGQRTLHAFYKIMSYIGSNRVVVIDTYANQRDENGVAIQYKDVLCTVQIPDTQSTSDRVWLQGFDLVFTEMLAR